MSTVELKEKLIEKIANIDDVAMLHEIELLIDFEEKFDGTYEMTPEEDAAVDEGREQIKNGQFFSNEESNKHVEEWLRKHAGL